MESTYLVFALALLLNVESIEYHQSFLLGCCILTYNAGREGGEHLVRT